MLNSPIGKNFINSYLTSHRSGDLNNFLSSNDLLKDVQSKTEIKMELIPDELKQIIYLYANGSNLNYSYGTRWRAAELENEVFAALNTVSQAASGEIGSAAGAALETASAVLLLNPIENKTLRTLAQSKLGLSPAQNYEYLFDTVQRRKFGLTVTFMPKNEEEIVSVGKIIAAFKYYSHPARPNMNYYFRAPAVFLLQNITYVEGKGWVENLYLPKYKVCALVNTNVKYDQNGALITHEELKGTQQNTFKSPIKIEVDLSFEEIVLLTREDMTPPENFFDANTKNGYY
jgi:hypothetical protein